MKALRVLKALNTPERRHTLPLFIAVRDSFLEHVGSKRVSTRVEQPATFWNNPLQPQAARL
jgi:hypothetical protein